jgi:hypothetical protein
MRAYHRNLLLFAFSHVLMVERQQETLLHNRDWSKRRRADPMASHWGRATSACNDTSGPEIGKCSPAHLRSPAPSASIVRDATQGSGSHPWPLDLSQMQSRRLVMSRTSRHGQRTAAFLRRDSHLLSASVQSLVLTICAARRLGNMVPPRGLARAPPVLSRPLCCSRRKSHHRAQLPSNMVAHAAAEPAGEAASEARAQQDAPDTVQPSPPRDDDVRLDLKL